MWKTQPFLRCLCVLLVLFWFPMAIFFSFLDEVLCIPDCTENNPELLILCLQLGLQTCAIISCLFNAEIKFRHLYDDRPQGKTDRGGWDPRYTRSLSTDLLLQKCLRSEGNILSI